MAQHVSAVPEGLTRGYSNSFMDSLRLPAAVPALTVEQLTAMDCQHLGHAVELMVAATPEQDEAPPMILTAGGWIVCPPDVED